MFRFTGRVQYSDGRIAEFEAGTASLAAWERYAIRNGYPVGKEAPPIMSSLLIAHHALGIEQGADAWIETVEGVELDADEIAKVSGEAVPPTLPKVSTG